MARACSLEAGDEFTNVCGEVLCTEKGRLIFHCVMCEKIYDESVEYVLHLALEHDIEDKTCYLVNSENEEEEEFQSIEPELLENQTSNQSNVSLEDNEIGYIEEEWEESLNVNDEALAQVDDPNIDNVIQNFECGVCYQILESEQNFLAHIRQHENCVVADAQVAVNDEDYLIEEEKVPEVAATRSADSRASKSVKGTSATSKRKYKCKICGITMTQSSNMMGHIRRHSEKNRRFQCSYCPKKFFSRTETMFHERTHTGEKPYLCAECGASFRSSSQLTFHSRMHQARERIFKCEVCDKSFFDRYRLRTHMIVHKEARDQFCSECNAAFKHPKALYQHKKIHRNMREYECKMCGARFNQGPGLRSHLKSIHQL